LQKFIDIPAETSFVCGWLVGRPRIAASFLEDIHINKMSEDKCRDFIRNRTTQGTRFSFFHKMEQLANGERSSRDRRWIGQLMASLRVAVEVFLYSGATYTCTQAEMFELGFGILTEISPQVLICEPIVIVAAFNYFFA